MDKLHGNTPKFTNFKSNIHTNFLQLMIANLTYHLQH